MGYSSDFSTPFPCLSSIASFVILSEAKDLVRRRRDPSLRSEPAL